jgi:hypothetical protein
VENGGQGGLLTGLSDADLLGLRLAAQVLRHKAELDDRPYVASYFAGLEESVQGELASRITGIRTAAGQLGLALGNGGDAEDRRLVSEYLTLLVANEHLSPSLRAACRTLRARYDQ